MRIALSIGLVAAMLLILGIICGALQMAFSQIEWLKPLSLGCLVVGLLLVIPPAVIVLYENLELKQALDSELSDLPDLKNADEKNQNNAPRQRAAT